MKKILRKLVLLILKALAKRRLKNYKGKIIAVTGSTGKTSTKEAIYTILNSRFRVRKSKKSMNSEFGMLLTILDIDSGFSSATKWSWYLLMAFIHSFFTEHSDVILLEMGVDKPGDMNFLTSLIKPDIAVITTIAHVHLDKDQFSGIHEVFEEKSKLVAALKEHGIAVLNMDDEFLPHLIKKRGKKGTITFGTDKDANFYASGISYSLEGLKFILHHDHKRYEVLANVLGEFQVYVILPAIICAVKLGMTIEDAIIALERYKLPPGRMNVLAGINNSTIIDSSYNSSPGALKEALGVLKELGKNKRKIAVLGNMNELGDMAQQLHESIGEIIPKCADILLTVGSNAALMGKTAVASGMNQENVFEFKNAIEAAEFFKKKVEEGDLILVKGSQNLVRLERFVKEIMAEPEQAKEVLVRQEKVWQAKL